MNPLNTTFDELQDTINDCQTDVTKFVEGNNSACASSYGMGAYTTAGSFNNIQILRTNSVGWYSYKASLYGIKEYS